MDGSFGELLLEIITFWATTEVATKHDSNKIADSFFEVILFQILKS